VGRRPLGRPTDPGAGNLYDAITALGKETLPEDAPKLRAHAMGTLKEARATRGDVAGNSGPAAFVLAGELETLDGLEGIFAWHPTSTSKDDEGTTTIAVANIKTGRWKRITWGSINLSPIPTGMVLGNTTGATANPRAVALPSVLRIDVFTASGTWTNRGGVVSFYGIGCGAGGAGGERGAVNPGGGGGGSGGDYQEWTGVDSALLPSTLAVTIGTPGAGGAGRGTDGNGNDGGNGGAVSAGAVFSVPGGAKGLGSVASSGGTGGNAGSVGVVNGGNGGNGTIATNGDPGQASR